MSDPIARKKMTAAAELDYTFDWTPWLPDGDEIDTYTITIAPAGELANYNAAMVVTDTVNTGVRVWLKDGVAGSTYLVTCQIETANTIPRIDERILHITVT